jgi:hypothetical protein
MSKHVPTHNDLTMFARQVSRLLHENGWTAAPAGVTTQRGAIEECVELLRILVWLLLPVPPNSLVVVYYRHTKTSSLQAEISILNHKHSTRPDLRHREVERMADVILEHYGLSSPQGAIDPYVMFNSDAFATSLPSARERLPFRVRLKDFFAQYAIDIFALFEHLSL